MTGTKHADRREKRTQNMRIRPKKQCLEFQGKGSVPASLHNCFCNKDFYVE